MEIGGAKTFAAVTRENIHAFSDQLGVNPRAASRLLEQFTAAIVPAADELLQEFETFDVPQPIVRAGQLRVLNTIRHIVIREMAERLGPV